MVARLYADESFERKSVLARVQLPMVSPAGLKRDKEGLCWNLNASDGGYKGGKNSCMCEVIITP